MSTQHPLVGGSSTQSNQPDTEHGVVGTKSCMTSRSNTSSTGKGKVAQNGFFQYKYVELHLSGGCGTDPKETNSLTAGLLRALTVPLLRDHKNAEQAVSPTGSDTA